MRKMLLNKVPPGTVLGKTVFTSNGHVLLAGGARLNHDYLKRLQVLGFSAVMVIENFCSDLSFPELISDKTRIDGAVTVKHVFEEAHKYRRLDTGTIKSLVNQLVDEVWENRKNFFEIPDIRSYDGYIFAHSVNVCVLALRMGLLMNYNELQLRDLGIGAILHDIGMMFVDRQVLEKMGKLTPGEFEKIKQHSADGFNLLREQKDINLLSAHVAFQHHERVDGAGYPRLLKRADICEFARIVAIADMFDALISETKHRKSYPLMAAIEIMLREAGKQIDADLLNIFLGNVAFYPTGSLVELNTGEVGLVISNNYPDTRRPVVKVLLGSDKKPLLPYKELDIRLSPGVKIARSIEDENLYAALRKVHEQISGTQLKQG